MDFKNSVARRVDLYRNRKNAGIKLRDLLAYDTIMLLRREERKKLGRKFRINLGRYYAKEKYGLEFSKNSDVLEIFKDNIYSIYEDFIPKPGQTVIDIGAQYGDYAILCSKIYKARVYAFELLPQNFNEILENIKLNGLTEDSIKAFNIALGNVNKTEMVSYSGEMANDSNKGEKIKATFQTLDSYNLKADLLKIDVEGFELEVLEGSVNTIKKYHPRIIIETHSRALEKQTKEFLSKLNYKLKHEGRSVYNVNKEFDKVTNLFFE